MQWKGRKGSDHVVDARGESSGGLGGGGSGGLGLLMTIGRVFGIKGILVAVVAGALLWKCGVIDPRFFLDDNGRTVSKSGPVEFSQEEQERFQFVGVVLKDTEDVWTEEFTRHGQRYVKPTMKIYRGQVGTSCGKGNAAMGPFYCPGDQTVYIDLSFYDELARTFNSPGDFAQAYVIAHEVGHHVQKLLGTSEKVAAMQGRPDYNEYSVRLELQADYYAGVWANHSQKYLEEGDIEEAMRAANAIGDDNIQKKMQGHIVPHSFTHGTSEQRMRWFNKGFQTGKLEGGDTFSMPYRNL